MFELSEEQQKKLDAWLKEIHPHVMAMSIHYAPEEHKMMGGQPYYGAIGGGLTYSFTPTSLGVVVEVTEAFTKKTINLTDYDSW